MQYLLLVYRCWEIVVSPMSMTMVPDLESFICQNLIQICMQSWVRCAPISSKPHSVWSAARWVNRRALFHAFNTTILLLILDILVPFFIVSGIECCRQRRMHETCIQVRRWCRHILSSSRMCWFDYARTESCICPQSVRWLLWWNATVQRTASQSWSGSISYLAKPLVRTFGERKGDCRTC